MRRRLVSIPALFIGALLLTVLAPIWLVSSVLFDGLRGRWRIPTARLLAFAWCWVWLEICGVTAAAAMWIVGQSANSERHYALQRWWAKHLLGALQATCSLSVSAQNIAALQPGPVIMLARHASLADSLVSAYVVTSLAGMNPRYVLKRELLADPCLDVVGQRLPNHFLDREAADAAPELLALEKLVTDIDTSTVGIIFPEGTRANPAKRERAMQKILSGDPNRAQRLAPMKNLLPPRPAGAAAMLRGNAQADVVVAWHVGFEGLDTFGGILRALSTSIPPIRFDLRRIERSVVPSAAHDNMPEFTKWLDDEWMRMDREVEVALQERNSQKFDQGEK